MRLGVIDQKRGWNSTSPDLVEPFTEFSRKENALPLSESYLSEAPICIIARFSTPDIT